MMKQAICIINVFYVAINLINALGLLKKCGGFIKHLFRSAALLWIHKLLNRVLESNLRKF